jgi:acyl carrier protein
MEESAIYKRLNELFKEVFDDDSLVVTPETSAADVESWDSFNNVALMIAVEARFGIRLTTTEIEAFHKVGDLATVIARKTAAQ